jgi:hypothetical protein
LVLTAPESTPLLSLLLLSFSSKLTVEVRIKMGVHEGLGSC